MPSDHAFISPSGFFRSIPCPGWVRLSEGAPRKESGYAKVGTSAHTLGETCLKAGTDPMDYLGQTIGGEVVDMDMASAVKIYVDLVRAESEGKTLMIEQRFRVDADCWGTNDACVLEPWGLLNVYDYKHGAGKFVSAVDNSQMLIYALGAVGANNNDCFEQVGMTIVQPRCSVGDPVRRWIVPVEYLEQWRKEVYEPTCNRIREAAAADNILDYLKSGEHCQFCPCKVATDGDQFSVCPRLREDALQSAQMDFMAPVKSRPVVDPSTWPLSKIGQFLDAWDILSTLGKEVEAIALQALKDGRDVAGYKLVAKRANRAWKDENLVIKTLQARYHDDIYAERKLLSPAQMEKIVDDKAEVAALCETPDAGVTMAPITDKRPAVSCSAEHDFRPKTSGEGVTDQTNFLE